MDDLATLARALDDIARIIHTRNVAAGWWSDKNTGERVERNMGEMLCLVHSEISEALEADRKSLADDKLPQYPGLIVELIDALIREFDILGNQMEKTGVSITQVFLDKLAYNDNREDHKIENRRKDGGKAY